MNNLVFIFTTTLMYSTPLILAALGGVVSEKSGIINIGLEGMMTFGAFIGPLVTLKSGHAGLGLICAGLAGMLLSSLHAISSLVFLGNQVISGIALNFLGSGLSLFLCRLIFDGTSMTPPLDLDSKLPVYFGLPFPVYLAFFLTFFIWFIFKKTQIGLRLVAAGEHPKATESAGINQRRYKFFAILISGALAGFGGASLSLSIVSNFRPTLISGQGFIALAAVIFGNWTPIGAFLAALFFGFTEAMVVYLGGLENLHLSSQLLSLIPYIGTLLILILFMKKSKSPSALGEIK